MPRWYWIVLVAIAPVGLYLLCESSSLRWVVAGYGSLMALCSYLANRHFKRLKEERKEESICSFARALPARKHDTWVVRAVYEEMSGCVGVPLRPSDDFEKDLWMDPDDIDDLVFNIAHRARRSMDDTPKNPFFDRIKTVADLVAFIEHQQKIVTVKGE